MFVLRDDVPYVRGGVINRNRIKTPRGAEWLTVPVQTSGRDGARINEMMPCWRQPWVRAHLRAIELNYRRSPWYAEVIEAVVEPALREAAAKGATLSGLNGRLIRRIAEYLELDTPIVESSSVGRTQADTDCLVELVGRVGGTEYLSGVGEDAPGDAAAWVAAGIAVRYSSFEHPVYPQLWGRFEPDLSVIDALCNCGPATKNLIRTAVFHEATC